MSNVVHLHEIVVERAVRPAGWFTVTLRGRNIPFDAWTAWESPELAFAEAYHLKRKFWPARIFDRTGGAG